MAEIRSLWRFWQHFDHIVLINIGNGKPPRKKIKTRWETNAIMLGKLLREKVWEQIEDKRVYHGF